MDQGKILISDAVKLAEKHHQAGRAAEAESICRQVIAHDPRNSLAINLLGIIAFEHGHSEAAIELVRQAIALGPNQAAYFCNLGVMLAALGRHDEAIGLYHDALRINPKFPFAYHNLGNSLAAKNLYEESVAAYEQSLALRPDAAETLNNLGNALLPLRKFSEAIATFQRALAIQPGLIESHFNLGNAFQADGNLDDAIKSFKNALKLNPKFSPVYVNMGCAYQTMGEINLAIESYGKALASDPNNAMAVTNRLFSLHLHPDFDAAMIAREHRVWNDRFVRPSLGKIGPYENDRSPDRRLKIGYVSADFRNHPVGRFLLPLFENHDHEKFEIFCYSNVNPTDEFTDRLRKCADGWRNIRLQSEDVIAEQIRQDRIDILIDLALHTDGTKIMVFARKPAPVQANYLAYCSTSGLETMDYRLSDPYLDPIGMPDDCYVEKTIHLAHSYWCYEIHVKTPEINPPPVLQTGYVTFGCLNNYSKNSKNTWEAWHRLLKGVPNSRLIVYALKGSHRELARERMAAAGIDPERLVFVGNANAEEYFQQYLGIDIALDPFPYGGGTTTCDALWMGVPVVTLRGQTGVGRGGASILSNIGLPELIANSPDEYVQIAAQLAGDVRRLTELRSTLRQRMKDSPLTNGPQFAGEVEAAYRQMWHEWCEKQSALTSENAMPFPPPGAGARG